MKIQTLNLLALIALIMGVSACKQNTEDLTSSQLLAVGESVSICAVTPELITDDQNQSGQIDEDQFDDIVSKLSVGGQACQMQQLSLVRGVDRFVFTLKKLAQGWEIVFRYIDGKVKSFTLKPGPKLSEQVTKVKEVSRRSLIDGDTLSWKAFIDDISKNGTADNIIRTSLVDTMQRMSPQKKDAVLEEMKKYYVGAYHAKHKFVGKGLAPKRSYDAIMRYLLGPEKFFVGVKSQDDIMTAWRGFFNEQYAKVFRGSDFGRYTPDDVLSIARKMQSFLKQQNASGVEILLKGSFPSGKANLHKRNPLDNVADSLLQGARTSYSDIDFLINKDWQKKIKAIEPNIYDELVSKEAKDLIRQTGAKPFFQTHPHPFDLYAELDGSTLSPIGMRINKDQITLIVYKPLSHDKIPSKETIEAMSDSQRKALYDSWASFYPLK